MPLKKIQFRPGVNRENTRFSSEGVWYESNLVRFRQGTPEKIGGWTRTSSTSFLGVARSIWNWVTLAYQNLLGVGTNLKFYIENGGAYYDITPLRTLNTLSNPFATVSGSPIVTVTDANSGFVNGDFVRFYNASTVGGITLSGTYQLTYIGSTTYQVTAAANATSTTTGGGTVYASYQISTGFSYAVPQVGWSASTWGAGAWGAGASQNTPLLLWNQSNFGQDLLYGQRGGPLYYWSAAIGYAPSTVAISIAAPAVVSSSTSGLVEGQAFYFETTGALPTGLLPGVLYYAKNVSGASFNVAATAGGTAITTSGSQSGVHSISPNGVSLTALNGASQTPLTQNFFLVSDSSRFVLLFGTNDVYSTVFDPMLIRWPDQGSLIQWNPAITNQAGSVRLSRGSKIVTALQSRQEILVWTDVALYNLQYLGPPYVWGEQLLADNVSIISPAARAIASNVVYWMGHDKFYMYDGRVQTLPCDLREYVYSNINLAQADQFFAGTNSGFNEVWWFYCSASSVAVDSYVVYNYIERCWYYGQLGRTAWLDGTLRNYPLAATYVNNIVYHEYGIDDNSTATPTAMNSYITSAEFEMGEGDRFAFVRRILPDLTFRASTADAPAVTIALQPLQNSGSGYEVPASVALTATAPIISKPVGTGPLVVDQYTGQVFVRVRGRQMSFKISCNTLGTQWQAGAHRFDVRPDGRK